MIGRVAPSAKIFITKIGLVDVRCDDKGRHCQRFQHIAGGDGRPIGGGIFLSCLHEENIRTRKVDVVHRRGERVGIWVAKFDFMKNLTVCPCYSVGFRIFQRRKTKRTLEAARSLREVLYADKLEVQFAGQSPRIAECCLPPVLRPTLISSDVAPVATGLNSRSRREPRGSKMIKRRQFRDFRGLFARFLVHLTSNPASILAVEDGGI